MKLYRRCLNFNIHDYRHDIIRMREEMGKLKIIQTFETVFCQWWVMWR